MMDDGPLAATITAVVALFVALFIVLAVVCSNGDARRRHVQTVKVEACKTLTDQAAIALCIEHS